MDTMFRELLNHNSQGQTPFGASSQGEATAQKASTIDGSNDVPSRACATRVGALQNHQTTLTEDSKELKLMEQLK